MSFTLPSLRGLASRLFSRPAALTHTPIVPSTTTTRCLAPPATCAARFSTTPLALGANQAGKKGAKPAQKGGGGKGNAKSNGFERFGKGAQAGGKKAGKKRGEKEVIDPKKINMLSHMAVLSPRRIPPPLRMGRNRHLRHWTIHRAWLLFRRQQREARERTLMRQFQSMNAACEALRLTYGPGTKDEGYLFRVALEKKGVYGLQGVPIEYARPQTDTPARVAWNHNWTR
ncbi:hypothetical protein C8A05DRAFT_29482 [Staphylotrichum tortipilum]|uniref:Large ribosomal subunit protein mL40 n=1 Tax=Staphylotrichum tortipilum TaxID=2831512 RepID=A0AAN6MU44_9PEZI|nr:hypothetical protein C8A05DRAFT_29482 [Staphylotrichum longicolle]